MTNQTTNTNNVSVEALLAALNAQAQANGNGGVQQLTNEQLMALLQAAANGQQASSNTEAKEEKPKMTFEYVEIKDLHLPNLSEEDKAKAIALANEIEKLRISINQRQDQSISVSDIEIQNFNAMVKDFRKITGVSFYGVIHNAVRGAKVKFSVALEKADAKSAQAIDDLQETANGVIDGFVALGVETLKFGGVFAKGTLNIGSTATKGLLKTGFNLFK